MVPPPPTAPLRLALFARAETGLAAQLRGLATAPEVREFGDLFADAAEVARLRPDVLLVAPVRLAAGDIGALRLMRALSPRLALVIAIDRARLAAARRHYAPLRATLLALPCEGQALAQSLEEAHRASHTQGADAVLDLARALSDEINNPLLFVTGHLQLLLQTLDRGRDADLLARLAGLRASVQRIEATMAKVRLIVRASTQHKGYEPVSLRAVLAEVAPHATVPDELGDASTHGEPQLLRAAVEHLVRAGGELAANGTPPSLALRRGTLGFELRLRLTPRATLDWQMPDSYEPFALARSVRAPSTQLGLMVVEAIAEAHGGHALASRTAEGGGVEIVVVLPAGEG